MHNNEKTLFEENNALFSKFRHLKAIKLGVGVASLLSYRG